MAATSTVDACQQELSTPGMHKQVILCMPMDRMPCNWTRQTSTHQNYNDPQRTHIYMY